jgi:hypothetical protein
LNHCTLPAKPINIGAGQPARVRMVAEAFGRHFGKAPLFEGTEQALAWHNDTSEALALFGPTIVPLETMIHWNADWIARGMPGHNKPTHYEERGGQF